MSNATFMAAIQALTITDVTRHYDEPPKSVSSADLPAAFPLLFDVRLGEKLVSCYSDNKVRSCSYAVLIKPAAQGTIVLNYAELVPMLDNMETAFDALEKSQGGTLTNFVEYSISAELLTVGDTDYLGLVAEVSAREI